MLTLEPIGVVRSPYRAKYDAPRQPLTDERAHEATIELLPDRNFEQALVDLEGFDRIWVIAWFDQAGGWKPKVLTPRDRTKRGVFATRSPHRPNPIALTCCEVVSVHARSIVVRGIDLLDGTPVLDIKPYLPYADAFPDARAGWVDAVSAPSYQVVLESTTPETLPAELLDHAIRVLRADPLPHPYRRTRQLSDGSFELAVQAWRFAYTITDRVVHVQSIVLQS